MGNFEYKPKSRARIAALRTEFLQIKYQPLESMAVYLGRLKQAKDRLESSRKFFDEAKYAYQILMNLHLEHANVVSTVIST